MMAPIAGARLPSSRSMDLDNRKLRRPHGERWARDVRPGTFDRLINQPPCRIIVGEVRHEDCRTCKNVTAPEVAGTAR